MQDIYELIENGSTAEESAEGAFDVESWKEQKQREREQAFALADEAAIQVNTDVEAFGAYLDVMARFPNHSAPNALLIFAQRPDATRVGSADYWSKQGARIMKGEKGFTVLEPGKEYVRDDGTVGVYYDARKVFDVSQTSARARVPKRHGTHDVLSALVTKPSVPILPADNLEGELAVYDHEQGAIRVQKGLSEPQLFWALATELAHASMAQGYETYNRDANAHKAELAAHVLARRYGIDAPVDTLPAPAPFGADAIEVRAALSDVRNAAKDVADRMRDALDRPKQREQALER